MTFEYSEYSNVILSKAKDLVVPCNSTTRDSSASPQNDNDSVAARQLYRKEFRSCDLYTVAAMILAGGASSRFGSNKALAKFKGKPLITHVIDILQPMFRNIYVVTKNINMYKFLTCPKPAFVSTAVFPSPWPSPRGSGSPLFLPSPSGRGAGVRVKVTNSLILLEDILPEFHPLGGLYSGLKQMSSSYAFVCACDMPFLNPSLIRLLCQQAANHNACVPVWSGKKQPLCAVYSKKCVATIENMLEDDKSKNSLHELLSKTKTIFLTQEETAVYDPQGKSFDDIDTKADYEYASTR